MRGEKVDRTQGSHDRRGDITVATLWLTFYTIVIITAALWPTVHRAVEVAAR